MQCVFTAHRHTPCPCMILYATLDLGLDPNNLSHGMHNVCDCACCMRTACSRQVLPSLTRQLRSSIHRLSSL